MNTGKIIIASFVAVVIFGFFSFVLMVPTTNVETENELPPTPKQEKIEPKISPDEPQINQTVTESPNIFQKEKQCNGNARCISGFVTRVIDGDTIVVGDKSIRFALVNTPEWGDFDYTQARNFIENICPVGSKVLVDEDDGQTQGSYGRIIAVIHCNDLNLNEEILEVGHAVILPQFCKVSEFADDPWAKKHGC